MKRMALLSIIFISISFAVKPVSKSTDKENKVDTERPREIIQIEKADNAERKETEEKVFTNHREDRFEDADSNNVNDQREDDLLKIKQLKTKFKDLLKSFSNNKKEEERPKKKTEHKR